MRTLHAHRSMEMRMWYKALAIGVVAFFVLSCTSIPQAGKGAVATLPEEQLQLVQASCFEVVTEKPKQDSLTYDKPLNWDLQDFAIRNDKYIPIGTAFAISANELVTAAHVVGLTPRSLIYTTLFIREKTKEAGKTVERVYEVENIRAFSNNRDYAVFTVKGRTFDKWLKIDEGFDFNTRVFTAGDAYGEGIVVREGVLLDEMPEPENGAWNFLKSSIATNPGSSGGPLMNSKGDVIGVVLSRKDDFCYSIPMKEIVPGKARIHKRFTFGFAVFNKQKIMTMDAVWDLPLSYNELADKYFTTYQDFYRDGMDKLLAENKDDLFPRGVNSEKAMFNFVDGTLFPQVFLQDSTNGSWFSTDLEASTTNIDKNGYVSSAEIYKDAGVWLVRVRKPTDTQVRELWDDPKKAMDLVLKGINITRRLTDGDQGSRVLSYGKPVQTIPFSDRFDRIWQINVFFLEYSDQFVMTCSTPTPQGLAMIYVARPSADKDAWLYDTRALTDFMNIYYYGTLEEWSAFLQQKDFHFGALKQVSISYKAGAYADIDLGSVSTRVRDGLISVNKDSNLYLGCSVFFRDGKPVWDIRKLNLDSGGAKYNNFVDFYRWTKPTASLPEDLKNQWPTSVMEQGHPYSGKVYAESGRMNVGMLHPDFVVDGKAMIKGDFAYTLFASKEGNVAEQDMKDYMRDFAKETRIKN